MVDATALRQLVGDVPSFLTDAWGRRPLHVPAGDDRRGIRDLLTLDAVDEVVAASGLRAPSFRLVRAGTTLPTRAVTRRARVGGRPIDDLVDVDAVHREVGQGATLVLQGLHRSHRPVLDLCRDLETTLTHPVQANAYLTPPVAQGLNLHEDPHDVFAVQTYGTKRWVVHPPDAVEPWDLQLAPGDVLYLPAGTRHAAQTIDEPSLHLTIGVRAVTWQQVVDRAVRRATTANPQAGGPLPAGWADRPELHRDRLADELAALATALRDDRLVDDTLTAEARRFWEDRPVDRRGGLRDLLEADAIGDRTPLRRRQAATAELHATTAGDDSRDTDDGQIVLRLVDRDLRLPAAVDPAMRRILDGEVTRPADLADVMDERSRLVLCRRLVREGFLSVVRPPRG